MKVKDVDAAFLTIAGTPFHGLGDGSQQNQKSLKTCLYRILETIRADTAHSPGALAERVNSSYALTAISRAVLARAAVFAERELDHYEKFCAVVTTPKMRRQQMELFDRVLAMTLRRGSTSPVTIQFGRNIPRLVAEITEVVAENLLRFVEDQILNCDFRDREDDGVAP